MDKELYEMWMSLPPPLTEAEIEELIEQNLWRVTDVHNDEDYEDS